MKTPNKQAILTALSELAEDLDLRCCFNRLRSLQGKKGNKTSYAENEPHRPRPTNQHVTDTSKLQYPSYDQTEGRDNYREHREPPRKRRRYHKQAPHHPWVPPTQPHRSRPPTHSSKVDEGLPHRDRSAGLYQGRPPRDLSTFLNEPQERLPPKNRARWAPHPEQQQSQERLTRDNSPLSHTQQHQTPYQSKREVRDYRHAEDHYPHDDFVSDIEEGAANMSHGGGQNSERSYNTSYGQGKETYSQGSEYASTEDYSWRHKAGDVEGAGSERRGLNSEKFWLPSDDRGKKGRVTGWCVAVGFIIALCTLGIPLLIIGVILIFVGDADSETYKAGVALLILATILALAGIVLIVLLYAGLCGPKPKSVFTNTTKKSSVSNRTRTIQVRPQSPPRSQVRVPPKSEAHTYGEPMRPGYGPYGSPIPQQKVHYADDPIPLKAPNEYRPQYQRSADHREKRKHPHRPPDRTEPKEPNREVPRQLRPIQEQPQRQYHKKHDPEPRTEAPRHIEPKRHSDHKRSRREHSPPHEYEPEFSLNYYTPQNEMTPRHEAPERHGKPATHKHQEPNNIDRRGYNPLTSTDPNGYDTATPEPSPTPGPGRHNSVKLEDPKEAVHGGIPIAKKKAKRSKPKPAPMYRRPQVGNRPRGDAQGLFPWDTAPQTSPHKQQNKPKRKRPYHHRRTNRNRFLDEDDESSEEDSPPAYHPGTNNAYPWYADPTELVPKETKPKTPPPPTPPSFPDDGKTHLPNQVYNYHDYLRNVLGNVKWPGREERVPYTEPVGHNAPARSQNTAPYDGYPDSNESDDVFLDDPATSKNKTIPDDLITFAGLQKKTAPPADLYDDDDIMRKLC